MTALPLFKKVTQIGLVVNDIEATAKRYWRDVGVGPWKFYTIDPANSSAMMLRGKPVKHGFRAAIATIGDMELELIQPLDKQSVYAEHLAEQGEGLHHIAVDVEDYHQAEQHLNDKGYQKIQSGRPFDCAYYFYMDTDQGLGCMTEYGAVDSDKSLPAPDFMYPNFDKTAGANDVGC